MVVKTGPHLATMTTNTDKVWERWRAERDKEDTEAGEGRGRHTVDELGRTSDTGTDDQHPDDPLELERTSTTGTKTTTRTPVLPPGKTEWSAVVMTEEEEESTPGLGETGMNVDRADSRMELKRRRDGDEDLGLSWSDEDTEAGEGLLSWRQSNTTEDDLAWRQSVSANEGTSQSAICLSVRLSVCLSVCPIRNEGITYSSQRVVS